MDSPSNNNDTATLTATTAAAVSLLSTTDSTSSSTTAASSTSSTSSSQLPPKDPSKPPPIPHHTSTQSLSKAQHRTTSNAELNNVRESSQVSHSEGSDGERMLNQYAIKDMLGRGSFGTVYKAVDTHSNLYVAIKEMDAKKLSRNKLSKEAGGPMRGAFGRGRFRGRGGGVGRPAPAVVDSPKNPIDLVRGEIAIMKKLKHRNVVRLFEVLYDSENESLFMVYELCERGALMDISMTKPATPYSEPESRVFFQQLVLGIEYLHEHDIAHRDIKPDNLLISKDGVLKIVDFGVSEMFTHGNDKSKGSAGSPAFFAPEMCMANHGEISSKATDTWAMGVTLYCLLYGTLPFTGASIVQLYEAIKAAQLSFPDNDTHSPEARDLITKILQKDVSLRIGMDGIREHPWVTNNNMLPLLSKDENFEGLITEITEEDVANAVRNVIPVWTVLRAIQKFKKLTPASSKQSLHNLSSSSQTSLAGE